MNGIDPSDFDAPPTDYVIADLFAKPAVETDAATKACRLLERAGRYGWQWAPFLPDAQADDTWFKATRAFMFRPADTAAFLAPTWVQPVFDALVARYRLRAFKPGDPDKVGKIRTPFLAMLLSWVAAGGKDADERAKSIASVIALAKTKQDIEVRVDHFINETW